MYAFQLRLFLSDISVDLLELVVRAVTLLTGVALQSSLLSSNLIIQIGNSLIKPLLRVADRPLIVLDPDGKCLATKN